MVKAFIEQIGNLQATLTALSFCSIGWYQILVDTQNPNISIGSKKKKKKKEKKMHPQIELSDIKKIKVCDFQSFKTGGKPKLNDLK